MNCSKRAPSFGIVNANEFARCFYKVDLSGALLHWLRASLSGAARHRVSDQLAREWLHIKRPPWALGSTGGLMS